MWMNGSVNKYFVQYSIAPDVHTNIPVHKRYMYT